MSFAEKKVFTLPNCVGTAMTLTATVVNEENVPLLETEPLEVSLSQPVSALSSQKNIKGSLKDSSQNLGNQSAISNTHTHTQKITWLAYPAPVQGVDWSICDNNGKFCL